MLPPSISRDEFSRLFNLPAEAVDALIDAGRILCHVRHGEDRVPLDEIEAFFRDGLLRLFQTDAWLTRAAALEDDLTLLTAHWPDEEVGATPAAASEVDAALPAAESALRAVEPAGEAPNAPAAEPAPSIPRPEPELPDRRSEEERRSGADRRNEHRIAQRFVPRRQIDGIFNDVRFTILQLSNTGLRVRHMQPVIAGDEGKVSFALLTPPRSFVMRARAVWTSLGRFESGGSSFYISGLKITEHAERLATAVSVLRASHDLKPDLAAEGTNDEREPAVLGGISDDDIALIVKAAQHFAADPLEANRWYSRARFALADERVRRDAPRAARDREEVLGIWEYLDRQIEIPKVAGVLSWMKRSRAATV